MVLEDGFEDIVKDNWGGDAWKRCKVEESLVGIWPPTLDEFEQYEGRHKRRLSLKPGLTGLWQVSGRSDIKDFEEDLEYIDNWSIMLDLKMLFETVLVVLVGKGSK